MTITIFGSNIEFCIELFCVQELAFYTKISDNAVSRLCNQNIETISHLFSECPISNDLWENVVISWTEARTEEKVNITKNMKSLGCLISGPSTLYC